MFNLIRNENMKLYRRPRTWIMIGFLIFAVSFLSYMEWYYDDKEAGWRDQVTDVRNEHAEILKDPELDDESREYFEESVAVNDYHLENDIRTEVGTMWDGINTSAELIILITLFTVIVAGDSVAGEFTGGTIKLLLIRPASRLKVLLAKYTSMIMFGLLLLVTLFITSVIVNGIFFGFGYMDLPLISMNNDGDIIERSMVANLWKTYLLNGVSTIMFVTMAFMISTAFRSSAMAIGFSIFALFAGTILAEVAQRYAWGKYLLFSNLDLSQHLAGRPYQDDMTLAFSITVLAVYYILFNLVAWLVFTRRDVAA